MEVKATPAFPNLTFEELENVKIPPLYAIKLKHYCDSPLTSIRETVFQELNKSSSLNNLKPNSCVSIAVGSRGISKLTDIILYSIEWLKTKGLKPVIIPAMGSHGGATKEGQREVLRSLGLKEELMNVEIISSMDVVQLGSTEEGVPCYFSKDAIETDAILIINRVKSHTSFPREVESGLTKMVAVGLGKFKGAQCVHKLGPTGLRDILPKLAKIAINKSPVAYGLALVENSRHEITEIRGAEPKDFFDVDKELLIKAKNNLAKLPFKQIDVLIVEKFGKNISGMGMDYAVIGRTDIRGLSNPSTPFVHKLVALTLTEESKGNGQGIGMADFVPNRLVQQIDLKSTYMNALSASVIEKVRIPPVFANDKEAIKAAIATSWCLDESQVRLCIIESTLDLKKIFVTKSLFDELNKEKVSKVDPKPITFSFDEQGNAELQW